MAWRGCGGPAPLAKGWRESGAGALALTAAEQLFNLTQTDVRVHVFRRRGGIRPFFETMFWREWNDGELTTDMNLADDPNSTFAANGFAVQGNAFSGRGGVTMHFRLGMAVTF